MYIIKYAIMRMKYVACKYTSRMAFPTKSPKLLCEYDKKKMKNNMKQWITFYFVTDGSSIVSFHIHLPSTQRQMCTLTIKTATETKRNNSLYSVYNMICAVNALYSTAAPPQNTQKRRSIVRPLGRAMECLLWVHSLMQILHLALSRYA